MPARNKQTYRLSRVYHDLNEGTRTSTRGTLQHAVSNASKWCSMGNERVGAIFSVYRYTDASIPADVPIVWLASFGQRFPLNNDSTPITWTDCEFSQLSHLSTALRVEPPLPRRVEILPQATPHYSEHLSGRHFCRCFPSVAFPPASSVPAGGRSGSAIRRKGEYSETRKKKVIPTYERSQRNSVLAS